MSLYKSLQVNFLLMSSYIFMMAGSVVIAQNKPVERELLSLFQIIEDENERKDLRQKAIQSVISMGKKATPFVVKRFKQTEHTHYFYILEKIPTTQKNDWQKQLYFQKKYEQALQIIENGKNEEGIEILRAILALESDISFADEIKDILKTKKEGLISFKAYPTAQYFSFKDEWKIIIAIKNNSVDPIVLSFAQKRLHLKIRSTEYYFSGDNRTDVKMKYPKMHKKIAIDGGKWWKAEIAIPPFIPRKQCYQELDIAVDVKTVSLTKKGKNYFPKIEFPVTKIKIMPKKYHVIMSNPTAYFEGAVQNRYFEVLFYSSFFIPQKDEKKVTDTLINNLQTISFSPLTRSILLRFTKQNFSNIRRWKSWWRARKGL